MLKRKIKLDKRQSDDGVLFYINSPGKLSLIFEQNLK